MDCPACGEPLYYSGEHHPTGTPQRYYGCSNRHMVLVYGQKDEDVEWGDRSVTRAWRNAIRDKTSHEWEMVGKTHWKS